MTLSSIASILFYISIFIFVILFSFLYSKTKKKPFAVLSVIVPALLVAARDKVGTDTSEYLKMFDEVSILPLSDAIEKVTSLGIEPFAVFSIRILGALGFKYFSFYFIFALITFGFIFLAARKYPSRNAWLFYSAMAIIILPFSINVMRQAAAIAVISLLIARLIYNPKEHFKNVFLFIFAISLHFSVAMLLPLFIIPVFYKLFGFKRTATVFSIVIIASLIIFPKALSFALDHNLISAKYTETLSLFSSNILNFDFVIFGGLFVLLTLTRKHKNGDSQKLNDLLALIVLCNLFYSGIGFFSAYLGRMSDYFWPTAVVSIWLGLDRFKDSRNVKVGLYLTAIILYFITTCIILGNSQIIPYRFI